jgi:DNA-binding beta-propeller fold protein YncE
MPQTPLLFKEGNVAAYRHRRILIISKMSAELTMLSSFELPPAGGNQVRALHTVVEDDDGNIYYSDEFNHSVVSLDPRGETRWQASPFRYPRGMAIGFISEAGLPVQCLAICDSWNDRIQFFGLDGRWITSWNSAGGQAFKEVTDIRYLTGYWLVLDRQNHRLCRIATDGRLLSEFGRYFDPLLEPDWAASLVSSLDSASLPFDPLFYADRILGNSESELFVWEPLPRHLKQIAGDNLHTISISAPHTGEWIAADPAGLVSWSASAKMLTFHDRLGSPIAEAPFAGKPVFSSSAPTRVWMQQGTELRKVECSHMKSQTASAYGLLQWTTDKNIGPFLAPGGPWSSALDGLQAIEDRLLAEACKTAEVESDLSKADPALNQAIRDLATLWLPNFLSGQKRSRDVVSYLAVLQDRSERIQKGLDDILQRKWTVPPAEQAEHARLERTDQGLQTILKAVDRANELLLGVAGTAPLIFRRTAGFESGFLREVDRIFVGDPVTKRPAHPNHLARTSDGHIFVTGWNQVIHLDPTGKVVERIGDDGTLQSPIGIAADDSGLIWVAEFSAERLSVFDTRARTFAPLSLSSGSDSLRSPHGLCYRPDGWTLVADTGNSRILAVSPAGDTRILTSRSAREPGQFWLPIGVFINPSDRTGAFWVVDHRNHRLQEFDGEGNSTTEIGGRGVGKGRLLLPECACFLSGGLLLVSQRRFNRVLKLFTPEGVEMGRSPVDYSPAGILQHDRFIMIANVEGSDIRVYERR